MNKITQNVMAAFLAEHKIVHLRHELAILFYEFGRENRKEEGKHIDFEGFCQIFLPKDDKNLR